MIQARWRQDPVLHLASSWNRPHKEGETVEVRAYTNCDVELYLNGKSFGSKPPGNPVIWEVPYTKGRIHAVGRKEQRTSVEDSITTPTKASKIQLSCAAEILGDGKDAVLVVARVTDDEGNVVPDYEAEIKFKASGPARIWGLWGGQSAVTKAGIAGIVLKAEDKKGRVTLTASAPGLRTGSATIDSV